MDATVKRHNETLFSPLKPGDSVKFHRGLYKHYGVYVGNEEIVHLTGVNHSQVPSSSINGSTNGVVKKDNLLEVAGNSMAYKAKPDPNIRPLPTNEIVAVALSMIGTVGYNLITNNCEHFVNFCRYLNPFSLQVVSGMWIGLGVGVAVVGLLALGIYFYRKRKRAQKNKSQ